MIANVPYIDQVIKGRVLFLSLLSKLSIFSNFFPFFLYKTETLRLYPQGSTLNRRAKNDYQIAGTDFVLKKGDRIEIPSYAIQRDPEYYPNPDKFDPDRFESNEVKKRHQMTFLAFGDGPRNCIAYRFAMMQINIALIILLNAFEFSTCSKTIESIVFDPHRGYLTTDNGIYLQLEPIDY